MGSSRLKKVGSQLAVAVAGGLVAVTLTGGGPVGAFSVPNNSVTSAKIVNGTIQGIDIKLGTIGPEHLRLNARPRWALVAQDGLVRGRGVTAAGAGGGAGQYGVVFGDPVVNCAFTVSSLSAPGAAWNTNWADEFYVDRLGSEFPNMVQVFATSNDGVDPTNLGDGQEFALVAHC